MRYLPRKNDFFEDVFDSMFNSNNFHSGLLKTDVHEKDGRYYLTIDAPGYSKENIDISLYQGNLTITANKKEEHEDKDQKGSIIRQERFQGTCTRTFYVGEGLRQEDIKANLENGLLSISFPTAKQKEIEERKTISIE